MIRKLIIVVQTLAAILALGTGVIWLWTALSGPPAGVWFGGGESLRAFSGPPIGRGIRVRCGLGSSLLLTVRRGRAELVYTFRVDRRKMMRVTRCKYGGFHFSASEASTVHVSFNRELGSWVDSWGRELPANYEGIMASTKGFRWSIGLPMWALFVVFTAYPASALVRGFVRGWRRRKLGLCLKCGYDLTGNVSGVCPECGTEVPQP